MQSRALYLQNRRADIEGDFWQQWSQNRDHLYRCCIKWMGGNYADAEDALSRAMLKAWKKTQKHQGEISNYKAWLTQLTHNLCVDIHQERDRTAHRVENIDAIAHQEEQGKIFQSDTPASQLEIGEKKTVIQSAINHLPTKLRETFILHFYQDLSYQEIAQKQAISYQNVGKRISQARVILQRELREYFIGENGSEMGLPVIPTLAVTKFAIGERSQRNTGICPISTETVTLMTVPKKHHSESINYQLTATCLATLSHTWYSFSTPLE